MTDLATPLTSTTTATASSYTLIVSCDPMSLSLNLNVRFFSKPDEKGNVIPVMIAAKERRGVNDEERKAFWACTALAGETREAFDRRACALFLANQYGIK